MADKNKIVRARLIVSGEVQGVGFRMRVRDVAMQEQVRGLVRNRRDGTVEVFCEAESREQFEKFVERLHHPYQAWPLPEAEPERVEVFLEGEQNYEPAWKAFDGFEIDSKPA